MNKLRVIYIVILLVTTTNCGGGDENNTTESRSSSQSNSLFYAWLSDAAVSSGDFGGMKIIEGPNGMAKTIGLDCTNGKITEDWSNQTGITIESSSVLIIDNKKITYALSDDKLRFIFPNLPNDPLTFSRSTVDSPCYKHPNQGKTSALTSALPKDSDHERFYLMKKKQAEKYCAKCHDSTGVAPLAQGHPPKTRCLFCHKRPK